MPPSKVPTRTLSKTKSMAPSKVLSKALPKAKAKAKSFSRPASNASSKALAKELPKEAPKDDGKEEELSPQILLCCSLAAHHVMMCSDYMDTKTASDLRANRNFKRKARKRILESSEALKTLEKTTQHFSSRADAALEDLLQVLPRCGLLHNGEKSCPVCETGCALLEFKQ